MFHLLTSLCAVFVRDLLHTCAVKLCVIWKNWQKMCGNDKKVSGNPEQFKVKVNSLEILFEDFKFQLLWKQPLSSVDMLVINW